MGDCGIARRALIGGAYGDAGFNLGLQISHLAQMVGYTLDLVLKDLPSNLKLLRA